MPSIRDRFILNTLIAKRFYYRTIDTLMIDTWFQLREHKATESIAGLDGVHARNYVQYTTDIVVNGNRKKGHSGFLFSTALGCCTGNRIMRQPKVV